MPASRLFTRDFTLMTVGQIISLFGNAILRFALSLHVLALTGSAAVFGGILALSMVPTALLSPLGGILADRMPRARIMVILDFSTCAFILLFDALFARSGNLAAVTLFMVLLSLIQAVYQPSVQASVPTLVAEERLTAANGVVLQVQALTGLLGPVLGGILMGFFGIYPILAVSAGCFFGSAVLELFLHIPFTPQPRTAPLLIQARDDLAVAFRFLSRDYPALLRLLGIVALINLFLSSLFTVGLPYLVKVHLGLSDQLYGLAEAMSCQIDLRSVSAENAALVMTPGAHKIEARFNRSVMKSDGGVIKAGTRVLMTGFSSGLSAGSVQRGSAMECYASLSVYRYRWVEDGQELFLVDQVNQKVKVKGRDYSDALQV